MPMFSYQCQECGKTYDIIRSVDDRDKTFTCGELYKTAPDKHETCGGVCERTIALTAPAQFKGGGWTPKHF